MAQPRVPSVDNVTFYKQRLPLKGGTFLSYDAVIEGDAWVPTTAEQRAAGFGKSLRVETGPLPAGVTAAEVQRLVERTLKYNIDNGLYLGTDPNVQQDELTVDNFDVPTEQELMDEEIPTAEIAPPEIPTAEFAPPEEIPTAEFAPPEIPVAEFAPPESLFTKAVNTIKGFFGFK